MAFRRKILDRCVEKVEEIQKLGKHEKLGSLGFPGRIAEGAT